MAAVARLELQITSEDERLIEAAAAARHPTVSRFVVEALVRRAREVVGERTDRSPRPIGGWSFPLPDGWDAPLDDFEDWR